MLPVKNELKHTCTRHGYDWRLVNFSREFELNEQCNRHEILGGRDGIFSPLLTISLVDYIARITKA